ncbi:MAG TPA: TIGR01777 family oxidoreductase [Bryobacteraceae bacterium]|nr:TIGR01777 family oxidoreductase [Bryobacteraceae bacterium]
MIAITGASGFIGGAIAKQLRETRSISTRGPIQAADLDGCGAIVNLAGETVAQRWTSAAKQRIRSSRVEGTRKLVDAIGSMPVKPRVLVSASAMGIYGSGFLQEVCEEWEREANRAGESGVRVVLMRFTTVLGDGGALKKMLPPFRLGLGGKVGDGKQVMSWIHVRDAARFVEFAIEHESLRGPVDAASPNPVNNARFTRELGHALHRPTIFTVPKFALNLAYGEMAHIIYDDLSITPQAAIQAGFRFDFPELGAALRDLI